MWHSLLAICIVWASCVVLAAFFGCCVGCFAPAARFDLDRLFSMCALLCAAVLEVLRRVLHWLRGDIWSHYVAFASCHVHNLGQLCGACSIFGLLCRVFCTSCAFRFGKALQPLRTAVRGIWVSFVVRFAPAARSSAHAHTRF